MNDTTRANTQDLAAALADSVGPNQVSTVMDDRARLSTDLFIWDDVETPDVLVAPTTAADVTAVLNLARAHGRPVYIRGGGMSYTNGYGPTQQNSILIDLRSLNQVREVDVTNRYVVAEAGCTWADVVDALKDTNMIVDFPAPLSGSHSTVGGAISQNVPGGMHGLLGLEVALADGSLIRTGAWSSIVNTKPFYRNYGPDLTGLFIGDNGIFGVKTAAAIHLKARLNGAAYGSFAFETYEDMAAAMIAISPMDFITRRTGLDPYETANIAKVGLGDAIKTLTAAMTEERTLLSGVKSAAKLASAGTGFLDGVKWSLHLKVDAVTDRAAEDGMAQARDACLKHGREIPAILPRARDAVRFSIRKFLGKDGERWVATSSLWPIGRAVEVATKVEDFFRAHREKMIQFGVQHSYVTNCSPFYFLCEPCFYWNDSLSRLHLDNVSKAEAEKFAKFEPNEETRTYVRELRTELRDFFQELGSIHVQIGDFYHFQDVVSPETVSLLSAVKRALDPNALINASKLDGITP